MLSLIYPDFIQELLVVALILILALPRRNDFVKRVILTGASTWIIMWFWCDIVLEKNSINLFKMEYVWSMLFYSVLYLCVPLVAIILFFKLTTLVNWIDALYGMTLAYMLQHIGYCMGEAIVGKSSDFISRCLIWIIYLAVVIPLTYYCGKKMAVDRGYEVSLRHAILLLIIVLTLVLVLNWIIRIRFGSISRFFYNAYIVYDITCCVVLLLLQLQQKKELELRAAVIAEQQLRRQLKDQYELSKENIEIINEKSHDLKHQIGLLRGLAGSQEQEALIKSLEEEAIIYDLILQTDNEAINVIFTEKGLLCKKYGIQWTCMLNGASFDFMKTVDIYSLFGNALDNAIEACRKLRDANKKVISVTSRNQSGMLIVEIVNYYEGTLKSQNGKFITSKGDYQNHGFGLSSMRRTVESYGGQMEIITTNNIFRLLMLFPVEDKKL